MAFVSRALSFVKQDERGASWSWGQRRVGLGAEEVDLWKDVRGTRDCEGVEVEASDVVVETVARVDVEQEEGIVRKKDRLEGTWEIHTVERNSKVCQAVCWTYWT